MKVNYSGYTKEEVIKRCQFLDDKITSISEENERLKENRDRLQVPLKQRIKELEAYKFEAEKLADAVIRNNQLRMDGTHEQQLVKLNVMSLMLTLANKLKGKSDGYN